MANINDEGIDITDRCNCSRHMRQVKLIGHRFKVYFLEGGEVYCPEGRICQNCGNIIEYDAHFVEVSGAEGTLRCESCGSLTNGDHLPGG